MIPVVAKYGNTFINADELSKIRGSGKFNPPSFNPYDEMINWRNIKIKSKTEHNDQNKSYACKPLGSQATFNQQAFNSWDNYLLQLYFNENNIAYIKQRVKDEIFNIRNEVINPDLDDNTLQNLMQETLTMAYQGKMPQIIENSDIYTLKNLLGSLNGIVINKYMKHAISSIDMYKYYINDITTLPVPLERPIFTDITGSNVTSQQVGLQSVEEFNKDIRSWNNRFSYFKPKNYS